MRRKVALRLGIGIAALLLLTISLSLISYASWVRGIENGNRALANGDIAAARQAYDVAARRDIAPRSPGYRQLVFNRARALYESNQDDELTRMLEAEVMRAPFLAGDSEYHFWMGNVQFRRALAQKDKQALQAGLQQAVESYRRSLIAAPDDWDAKYNYELTSRLLDGMRKGKEENLEKLKRGQMKVLREDTEKNKEQQRQLAPEKRG